MCWHDRRVVEMEEVGRLSDEDVIINFFLAPRATLPQLQSRAWRSPLDDRHLRVVDATWPVRARGPGPSSERVRKVFSPTTAAVHAGGQCMARRF